MSIATQNSAAALAADSIRFELDGRLGRGCAGRVHPALPRAARASTSRTCATPTACVPTATAAPVWSRSTASACWRRPAAARRRRA
ncbi:hypothetical protein [Thauera humireducens]|uniref:hypothetical protein n=1 Tax=Thauera humireducens TaxID=1134435 RepID=UPI00311DC375